MSNRVARILGKVENTERFLRLALYQGVPSAGTTKTKRLGAGVKLHETDPTLVACAHGRPRLFLFTRREPAESEEAATGRCARPSSHGQNFERLLVMFLLYISCRQHLDTYTSLSVVWQ